MTTLPPAGLAFVEQLVGAHDIASLYEAFKVGLVPIFEHHTILVSSHTPSRFRVWWTSRELPKRPKAWWIRHDVIHPGLVFIRAHPGLRICTMTDTLSEAEMLRHPFYREYMRPFGWHHGMGIAIWGGADLVGVVAIARTREQGDFSAAERALAMALQPFIAAAWQRIADHSRVEDTLRAHEALIATLPVAALVYSALAEKVVFYNRAAREAVARWRGEGARNRPRRLTTRWLPEEIVAACNDLPRGGAEVRHAGGGMRAILRRMDARAHFEGQVVLIVIEEEGAGMGAPAAAWLQVARGFSIAEQQVAHEVVRGLSNVQIAELLGKSKLTVKKQLESVFAKAKVTSRGALGALYSGHAVSQPPRMRSR